MARIDIDFWLCIAKYLGFDLAIVLSCIGFGLLCERLLHNCSKNFERLFFRFVLGAGVWMFCIFLAGSVHALFKTTILGLFALSLIPICFKVAKKDILSFSSIDWLTVGVMLASFVTSFWYSMYPARFYEDLNYHLPLAQFFLNTHSIDPAWHLRFPVGSQGTDLLFLPLQAFSGDIAAQQLSVVSYQMLMVGICCCARRFGRSVKAGQIAVLASLTGTHVLEMSPIAFIDMNFALFVSAAIYAGLCFLDARQNESRKHWAVISGICFGLSISSSLMGLVPLVVFVGLSFVEALGPKSEVAKKASDGVSGIFILITVAAILSAPWFIRTYIYTHNPVFPFFAEFLGFGGIWNAKDLYAYKDLLREDYGLSKDLLNILSLPWTLSFPPASFAEPSMTPTLLLALVVGVPLSFLPHAHTIRRLLIIICAVILVWFFWGHYTTYLLGIVPAVSVLTGVSLARFWPHIPERTDRPTQVFIVAFCTAVVLIFGAVEHSLAFLGKYCDPIPATPPIRSMLLDRWVPINTAFEFANKLPASNLYTYKNPDVKYLYKGITYGDLYGQARFGDFAVAARHGQSLMAFLNKFEIKYLVVERNVMSDLHQDDFFKRHFHQLFSDETAVLYQLE